MEGPVGGRSEYGLKNIGLGARDTLRLEKGFCLYGNDIDDTTSPIEPAWAGSPSSPRQGVHRPSAHGAAEGRGRCAQLVGFKMVERGIPRHGYTLAAPSGEPIGHVTSGTMSPCMKVGFGLGYVAAAYAKPVRRLRW